MQDCGRFEETIPQLIRQTWQFERSLQHQGGPHSQASNACQKEGTNRVKGGNTQGTGLLDRRRNHHGASRTNTVGLFSDIPKETKRRSKNSTQTGRSNSLYEGRCFEGISSDTSHTRSFSLDNFQLTQGMASILTDAFWSQNEPRRVSATDGCHSRAVSRSHRNSRWRIFGVDQQDHDTNLINLLNVCQKEGLVLNSKKLELRRERVTFFGAEYSTQGMHPDPKKVQGITEMTAPMDKQQLQSFLGMVNYMGTFIPNLSHHTEPLLRCLKRTTCFIGKSNKLGPFSKSRP